MKYLVLKNEDIERYTGNLSKAAINKACTLIKNGRMLDNKPVNNCYLVVNTDELYAGRVADIIETGEKAKGTWDHGDKTLREVMGISQNRADGCDKKATMPSPGLYTRERGQE